MISIHFKILFLLFASCISEYTHIQKETSLKYDHPFSFSSINDTISDDGKLSGGATTAIVISLFIITMIIFLISRHYRHYINSNQSNNSNNSNSVQNRYYSNTELQERKEVGIMTENDYDNSSDITPYEENKNIRKSPKLTSEVRICVTPPPPDKTKSTRRIIGPTLIWKNIYYDVSDPQLESSCCKSAPRIEQPENIPFAEGMNKRILKGLSGIAPSSKMLCIIGPSGCGKSSLMNILSGRISHGVHGDVFVNNKPLVPGVNKSFGYCLQEDIFFTSLTVKEVIIYAAELKLPFHWKYEDKMAKVRNIISELDLEKCENTRIGFIGTGISGGERRRLSIAIELLNDPQMLVLDEPTSGVDSASAFMICSQLKKLADRGMTIICTLHQPRYSIIQLFDSLLLLNEGETVYFGPVIDLIPFFTRNEYNCPPFENPIDFVLDLINSTINKDESKNIAKKLISYYANYTEKRIIAEANELLSKEEESEVRNLKSPDSAAYYTPYYNQFSVVIRRSFFYKFREPISFATQAFNSFLLPLLIGSIYWQIESNQNSIFDRVQGMSFMLIMMSFVPFDVLLLLPIERKLFHREHDGGMYSAAMFYLGRILSETPTHIFFGFCAANISYFMYGLELTAWKWYSWNVVIVLMVLVCSSLYTFLGAVSANLEQSNVLGIIISVLPSLIMFPYY